MKHETIDFNNQLRILQQYELENLDELIRICQKYNLRYYLIGGSLIGVLRHKGFIPWDDDIDVGLPRADYNRFVKIAKKEIPEHMSMKTMTSDPNYKCYFTRLINNKKKIYWDHGQYTAQIGIWMDVFPLDGLPQNLLRRKLHVLNVKFYKALYKFTQIEYVTTNKQRHIVETIIINFAKITKIGKLFDSEKRIKHLDKVLQKYDYDSSEYIWNFSGCYGRREIVPKRQFDGIRTSIFEGRVVSIPIEGEAYLSSIYGDWRKLPPKEKQVSHTVKFVD